MQVLTLLALCTAAVSGAGIQSSSGPQRIWGGSGTNIGSYPYLAALLQLDRFNMFWQTCAGTILNNRAVLTVAHCITQDTCRNSYASRGITITDNMLCASWDSSNRGHCSEDAGTPLLHNGVLIGVFAFRSGISNPEFQSVHTRHNITHYTCQRVIDKMRVFIFLALCFVAVVGNGDAVNRWRIRLGSTWANSGGVVHNVNANIVHGSYNSRTLDNDIAILRSSSSFSFNNNVRAASIAGANYNVADNQAVWAAGWGTTSSGASSGSEQLRHVQLQIINQNTCRNNYATRGITITANMLCSGWPSGGRDQCQGDSGGPLYHNNVVVGVCSFGIGCGQANFPGVNARVSRYASWISSNS
ncbi:hypothetical protein HF086_015874 [Spodoptera exigua]|uniref:Peptidase S1 domain-containing protein n=1 Tax=Spodoptera exigua TaxID=7107 RepID=A0A922M1Q9_SPOEX|nr:hypothetical protein HF086_015874 [Spodoptera exigua]